MDLESLRRRIDAIDNRLLGNLAERARLLREVVQAKHAAGIPTHAASREASMFARLRARAAELDIDPDYAHELWSLIIVHTKEIECDLLGLDTPFAQTRPSDAELRQNLLALTDRVAPAYSTYRSGETSEVIERYLARELRTLGDTLPALPHRALALDLGCAAGHMTEILEASFEEVRACDLSAPMITAARDRRPWPIHVTFAIGDAVETLEGAREVSLVAANFGTGSEFPPDVFFQALACALAPGARALLSFYNAEALSLTWYHPWPSTLHARLNPFNDTLEVWYGAEVFTIPGWGMTVARLREQAAAIGLRVVSVETYPTVLSILPCFFFRSPRFRRALSVAGALDDALATSPPYAGTYLLAVLAKPAATPGEDHAREAATRPGGWGEGQTPWVTQHGWGGR